MAKVKIQGSASGTGIFTVTAPDSDTNRTITLPDGTGTLAFTTGDDDKLPLAGGTMTGTVISPSFTSTAGGTFTTASGNDLNIVYPDSRSLFIKEAGTTHVTVDNTGNVGIGAAPTAPNSDFRTLEIKNTSYQGRALLALTANSDEYSHIYFGDENDQDIGGITYYHPTNGMTFRTNTATQLQITSDGRGLSQFTAKCWINFDGNVSSPTIRDSHNVSSVTDGLAGDYRVYFSNDMANTDYCTQVTSRWDSHLAGVYYQYQYAGSVRIQVNNYSGVNADADTVMCLVFGD